MSELKALQAEVELLRARALDSEQALLAFSSGQVDAVANEVGASPVLLRAAQEKLHASERLLRAVFDGALDAMLLADEGGSFVDANPAACALFGLSHERLLGRSLAEFAGPQLTLADVGRALTSSDPVQGHFRLIRDDGQERELDFRATANILPGLQLSVLRDVSGLRRAHEQQARLAAIVQSSDDAIISQSLDGLITSWNKGAERLYQWSAEEALGSNAAMLIPENSHGDERRNLDRILDGTPVDHYDAQRLRKDGSLVEVALTVSPIFDATGSIVGASKIARDLTERRKAEAMLQRSEEQLRQVQKMDAIGTLAGGLAHDFNNMLSVILSYALLAFDDLKPGDPLRDDIEQIRRAAERATDLTRQLLTFSRRQVLQPCVLELGQVVVGMEKMLRRLLGVDVELSLLAPESPSRVFADPSQVEQLVMNLVVNARDAMPKGGKLSIEVRNVELDAAYVADHHDVLPGRYVMLCIADTGLGMDAVTRERIFEPFFTTKDRGKGTGLGLSTVFGIAKQSSGHIWVHSELAQGTSFKVYLPRTDQALETRASMRPVPATLRGSETILLVEDDEQVRVMTKAVLRRQGYVVLDAQNGGEAFLICEKHSESIELLLTDVVMPRMSGPELAERLAPVRPGMRVLFVSGYTEDSIVHRGVLEGGIAFLPKPITPDSLLLKVREVLDAR